MYTIVNKSNIAKHPFELHSHQQTAALYKRFIKCLVTDSLKTARSTRNKKLKPIIAIEDIVKSLTRTSEIHTHSRRVYPVSRCIVSHWMSVQNASTVVGRRTTLHTHHVVHRQHWKWRGIVRVEQRPYHRWNDRMIKNYRVNSGNALSL